MLNAAILIPAQQRPDLDLGNLLYLLVIFILPALSALGAWIRKKWGAPREEIADEETVYEVAVDDDDRHVLKPVAAEEPRRTEPLPTAKPMPPVAPQPPVARAQIPKARTARSPRSLTPQRPPPARTESPPPRAHPAKAVRAPQPRGTPGARPQRARPGRAERTESHSVFAATSARQARDADVTRLARTEELLAGESFDAASLRKAIVLSEILAPPLAMRRNDPSPFSRPD